ncbi:MAG: hypothetical protein ACM3SV_07530 [Betaproteobacteria bacterium]
MELELFDEVRDRLQQTGFTPTMQTKISLFITAAKNANALFLSAVELRPFIGAEHQLLHSQYFQEMESILLLAKVTRWVSDPRVYTESVTIAAPLWNEWRLKLGFFGLSALDPRAFYQGLALGHALLSQLKMSPIIPGDADPADPYVTALRRIEADNARMIQTQINLLRTVAPALPSEEREALIEEKQETIKHTFINFLQWLLKDAPAA